MITTYTKLSYPIVKLSQFATNPAIIHYDAVYGISSTFMERAMAGLYTLGQSQ
jgi:hypothetical protein